MLRLDSVWYEASLSRASPRLPFPALPALPHALRFPHPFPSFWLPRVPVLPPSYLDLHFSLLLPFPSYWVPGPEIQGTKVDLHLAPVGRPWRRSSPANPPNCGPPQDPRQLTLLNSGLTWKALGFTLLPSSSFHPGLDGNPESPEVQGRTFWQLSPSVRDRVLSGNAGSRKWIFTSSEICPCPRSDQSFWKVFQNLKSPHFSILGSELRH